MSASVVQLPTAAPRKVRQCWSRTRKADRDALLRFPDIYKTPLERSAEESALLLRQLEVTPALAIAVAMFQTMDHLDQIRVQAFIAMMGAGRHKTSTAVALEYCHFVTAKPDRQRAISKAIRRLDEEDE